MYSRTPRRPLPQLQPPEDSSDQDGFEPFLLPSDSVGGGSSTTAQLRSGDGSEKPSKFQRSRQRRRERQSHTNSRIEHLQKQIANLNKSRGLCHRCSKLLSTPHCLDLVGKGDCHELEFEMFDVEAPQRSVSELRGQIWMVLGVLMLVIGLHIHGINGSCEVYKITTEQLTSLKHQLANGSQQLSMTMYYQSLLTQQQGSLRLQTVPSDELMLEQRFDLSLRYDSLIRIMDNTKELLCFSAWMSGV